MKDATAVSTGTPAPSIAPEDGPLSKRFTRQYGRRGYLLLPRWFDEGEVHAIRSETESLKDRDLPGRVLENDERTVRALHGCHLYEPLFGALVRSPKLLAVARQLLKGDVYVYQFKINLKARFNGDIWQWHQDYIYWHHEDGMPQPDAITLGVFLDDVTEFNGPMMLIPRSHRAGLIDVAESSPGMTGWKDDVSAKLKYQLAPDTLTDLVSAGGLFAAKGKAGTLLAFHPTLAHASLPNLSPYDRYILFATYNRTSNAPPMRQSPRPEWLVARDSTPLETPESNAS